MEVLLALSLGGLVLVAATSLLITISQTWANRPATRDAFDAHINGVDDFLSAIMEEASSPPLSKNKKSVIDLKLPIGFSEADDPLIYFYLREAPPLFFSPQGKSIRVHSFLSVDEDELKRTLISPFCKEVFYCYYGDEDAEDDDIKKWEILSELKESDNGGYLIPAFVKLIFRWEDENLERTVSLAVERLAPSGIEEEPR